MLSVLAGLRSSSQRKKSCQPPNLVLTRGVYHKASCLNAFPGTQIDVLVLALDSKPQADRSTP